MTRWCIPLAFVLLLMRPSLVQAAHTTEGGGATAPCDAALRLAGVIEAEAEAQPVAAQIAIAQIVVTEAASREMDVCELTERTWFVSVYRYALAHPASWTASRFRAPQTWAVELAQAVLLGQLPPVLPGFGHFDGRSHGGDEVVIGQTWFRK